MILTFLIYFVCNFVISTEEITFQNQYISWSNGHLICSANLKSATATNITCNEANYLLFFRNQLKNDLPSNRKEYYTSIIKAVTEIYDDLAIARKPMTVQLKSNSKSDDNSLKSIKIHPISFCIPEENIVVSVPPKKKAFGRVIPGIKSTYFDLVNETQYFEDLSHSLFAITYKKGGWDCLRHLVTLY
jgi:hypothetical protein